MFNDLVTILTDNPRKKYVAYHRFISCVLERLLNTDYTQDAALGSTPSILTLMEDLEDDLKDFSDEEIFEDRGEMETDLPHDPEEPSLPPSTDKVTHSDEHHSPPT
ncbi:hypothetical protein Tco_1494663 [Tanacetum coccineum]